MGTSSVLRGRRIHALAAAAAILCLLGGLLATCPSPASAADVTIYVDTSAIDDRTDLTKTEKDEVKAAIKEEIKRNLETAFGPGKVEVTDKPSDKKKANRTVTIKNDLGTGTDKDGNTTHHWGEWVHGSSNTTVHLKNYIERWGSEYKTGTPPKWNTSRLGKAIGTTAAHELAHSFSAGHDDKNTNKMNTANSAKELGDGLNLNDAAKKTLTENKANPPCKAVTNYSTECCIASWWSDPLTAPDHEMHETGSITTLATFGGPMAPMFDFGWWGPDADRGATDGNPWGNFVFKSTMNGSLTDAPTITFFDGWTAHFVLRGRTGTIYEGQLLPVPPGDMVLTNPIVRPDGSEVFREIHLSWEIDGLPGPDVSAFMTTEAFGPLSPLFSGFRKAIAVAEPVSAGQAKALAEGSYATLADATVTRMFGDHFYVEPRDRSAGIRVEWWSEAPVALQEGFGVRLRGVVCTSANGERLLRADPAYVQIVPSPLIVPLGMANGSVGGGDFLFEAGLWPSGQEGIPGMHGANNTGLLVRTWGRVTEIDPAPLPEFPKWLRIEDGSRRNIKCTVTEEILLSPIWLGRFVSVTGISSCERDAAEQLVPIVKLKRPDDLLSLE